MPLNISPARRFSAIDAYGSGLERGRDLIGTVTVRGYDQYGSSWQPILDTNWKVQLIHDGKTYPHLRSSSNSFTYQMPHDGTILVLLSPIPRFDTMFKPQALVVTFGDSLPTNPSRCNVSWSKIVQGDTSVATVFAADSNGKRRFRGGDIIQTSSKPGAPLIFTTDIEDNLDGTYIVKVVLPDAAFTASDPAPELQFFVNGALVHSVLFKPPLTPLLAVSATTEGPGLTSAVVGKDATFNINIHDADGHLTSTGYFNATVYLVQTNVNVPKYLEASVGNNRSGVIPILYNVSSEMGAGSYQLYVYINDKQVETSPSNIDVRVGSIDDIDEACQITSWTLGRPQEAWDMEDALNLWSNKIEDSLVTLTASTGTPVTATDSITWKLKLPTVSQLPNFYALYRQRYLGGRAPLLLLP